MLTGKQRAYLKAMANPFRPIFQIGKQGISNNVIIQLDNALEARELIKINVLENSLLDTKKVACDIVNELGAEFVQILGNKITIYRASKNNPKIKLP